VSLVQNEHERDESGSTVPIDDERALEGLSRATEWIVHGERPIYQNRWVNLWLVDVEQPDGHRFEHHVVRMRSLAAVVVVDDRDRVLMMWRHRFITGKWAWEVPMGLIEDGETPAEAAEREVLEETGWKVGRLTQILYSEPANGITDSEHYLFTADSATYDGPPAEANEAAEVRWIPLAEIRGMIDRREIVSAASLVALLYVLMDRATAES
jgi:8-oxo-dGTP pyrophosphatase MutT (NUDIX family)